MKRKIFSKLLMVALVIASVSSFVSCKDYDDDINNLQNQINKAALQSELAALQQTVANNATSAQAAAAAAEAAAKKYADELAAKSAAQASDLEKLIAQVKAVADAAATKDDLGKVEEIAKAAATQAALTEAIAELNGAIEKVKAVADAAATKEELAKAQEELTAAIKKVEDAAAEAKTLAQKAQETADKANTDLAAEVTRAKEAEEKLDAAIKKALEDAKKYTDDALTASKAYTDDEVEKAAAKAADDLAKAIAKVYTKTEVDGLIADAKTEAAADAADKLAKALGDLGTSSVEQYVNTEIGSAVSDLKEELADTYLTKEDFEKITGISGSIGASINALYSAITSVSLYKTDRTADEGSFAGHHGNGLNFVKVQEQENKFPTDAKKAEADNQYIFTKDKYVTYEDSIIVRVSPASATLTADMIELINSQGVAITSEISVVNVARYNKLLTRAADGNGLWTITYKLKDGYDENAFLASTVFDANDDGKLVPPAWNGGADRNILFAVAVNNTKDDAADRRIVSEYDVTVNTANAQHAGYFTIKPANDEKEEWVYNVHNRYLSTEAGDNTTAKEELVWKNEYTDGQYTGFTTVIVDNDNPANPAANAYTRKNANDLNLSNYYRDNRQYRKFIYADVNEAIEIEFPDAAARPLKGFYVTLDRDYALESIPSEINAWDSYSYTNVGTKSTPAHMIDGNKGVIAVNSENAFGDYIGFRVYAVNLDGTLVDPDGRAFYIHVGRLDDTAQNIAANVVADRVTATSQVAKTATFDNWNTNNVYYRWTIKDDATVFPYSTKPTINKINYVKADGTLVTSVNWGDDTYMTAAEAKDAKGITVEFANIAQLYNNQTITLEGKVYKHVYAGGVGQNMEIGIVTAQITKVMPEFPANLQGRAAQFTNANATDHFSGGTLNLFLLQDANNFTLASWTGEALDFGKCDLVSAFYNLDAADGIYDPANLTFSFAASDKNASNQLIAVEAVNTAAAEPYTFPLSIKKAYINNTTEHNTTVTYNFGEVSTYIADDGSLKYAQNWTRNKAFTTIYDCLWDTKWMSYAWKENKAANTPSFTVGDEGKSIEFSSIYTKNTYNATVYGDAAFKTITLDKFTTALKFTAVTLTSNETGKEDYFTCEFDNETAPTKINLTATEDWHNPVADVPSTLTIKYTDQFDHKETLTLPVTVKKQ